MKTVRDVTPPLTETQIAKKLSSENLDELLQLWWTEQGVEKRRDLELMAAALPFPTDANLRVLDVCCGPGDVGRGIWGRYRNSHIDCVDRDVFLDRAARLHSIGSPHLAVRGLGGHLKTGHSWTLQNRPLCGPASETKGE